MLLSPSLRTRRPLRGSGDSQPLSYDSTTLPASGLPSNLCILAGFPTLIARSKTGIGDPFELWFANANTLYVADEGDGYNNASGLYTHAAAQTMAGLQKWVFDSASKTWKLAYGMQSGLGLGAPYTVAKYPTGNNAATGLPWAPAMDGLRNITGLVGPEGLVAIWGVSSTVSDGGDQGADPNRFVCRTRSALQHRCQG